MSNPESISHMFESLPPSSQQLLDSARAIAVEYSSPSVQIEHVIMAAASSFDPEVDQVLGITKEEDRVSCVSTFRNIVNEKDKSPQSALGLGRHRLPNVLQPEPFPLHPQAPRFHSETLFELTIAATKAQFNGQDATPAVIIDSILHKK